MEYGINVNNKYGFLSDEEAEDPEILLKKAIKKKDQKLAEEKKIAEEKAAAAAAAEATAESKRVANKENRREPNERGRGGRGRGGLRGEGRDGQRRRDGPKPQGEEGARPARGRGGANRPRRERPVKDNEGSTENAVSADDSREDIDNRRGGRVARVFRRGGPRNTSMAVRLDRKSGSDQTGVRAVDKKDGHGKGNWGTEQDELAAAEDLNVSSGGEVEREKTEEELKREAELERAARELTLSEFKARIAEKSEKSEFNIRKAGEGVDSKNQPKLVPLQRDSGDDHAAEEVVIVRREPKNKRLNIEVNFGEENRMSRGGGRGRGARGSGRGSGRDRRSKDAHFDLNQESFPALGGR